MTPRNIRTRSFIAMLGRQLNRSLTAPDPSNRSQRLSVPFQTMNGAVILYRNAPLMLPCRPQSTPRESI